MQGSTLGHVGASSQCHISPWRITCNSLQEQPGHVLVTYAPHLRHRLFSLTEFSAVLLSAHT